MLISDVSHTNLTTLTAYPSVLRKEQRAEEKDSEALRLKEIHILMHLILWYA